MADNKEQVETLKKQGNDALGKGKVQEAIRLYTEAIELDPENHVLFSNRSAAFAKQNKFAEALKDAEKTVQLNPEWPKGYSRKGAALAYLRRFPDAEEAYRTGLEIDPGNEQLKKGLEDCQAKKLEEINPFRALDADQRLRNHPKTAGHFKDPSFVEGLSKLARDHHALEKYIHDKRYLDCLAVLLGVDLRTADDEGDLGDPFVQKPPENGAAKAKSEPETKAEPEPMDQESEEKAQRKKEAQEEKDKGNAAYKKKDFATALAHYDRAFELDPDNIACLTNKAAVYFEQSDFDQCLEVCEKAVEKGRETRADFKLIAKALERMGNVYFKQKKWAEAVRYYDKSITEHRSQDVVAKRAQAQKSLKEEERLAYLDVDKGNEERQKGNDLFQKGKYAEALKCYSEAIKRNPDDPKSFSNRAACYIKLLEFPLAVKDCDECTRLDPKFIKGHIRKGQAHLGMKDIGKARQAYDKALEIDPNNPEAAAGIDKCYPQGSPEERRKLAMQDPEVQAILRDPAMQLILQQMNDNPGAIRDHLRNPDIAAKIQRLMDAGFISIR